MRVKERKGPSIVWRSSAAWRHLMLKKPHAVDCPVRHTVTWSRFKKPNLLTLSSSSYRTVRVEQPKRNRASSSLIPCYHRCSSAKLKKKKQKNKSIFPFVIGRATKQKEKKKLCPVFCFFSFVSFSPCSLRKIKQKKRRDYNNKRWQSVLLLCVSRSKVMRASRVSPLSLSLSLSLWLYSPV